MSNFPSFDLSCLTDRQRDVLEMRYAGGLGWTDIARLLGCNESVVRRHHARALAKLGRLSRLSGEGEGERP